MLSLAEEFRRSREAASYITERCPCSPRAGLILGSGLGGYADSFTNAVQIPYKEIPHFPVSSVSGHAGQLVVGEVHGQCVVAMQGRVHAYEGWTAAQVAFPVRAMHALGVRNLVVTNAAGGIGAELTPGSLVLLNDHLNLTGDNPLRGQNDDAAGPRFPDVSNAWTPSLRRIANEVAATLQIALHEGVYAGVLGPNYETPAEVRMLRMMGATVVGMSTVHEVIAAAHLDMNVLGISCVTNLAAGIEDSTLDHADVQAVAASVREEFTRLVDGVLQRISSEAVS